MKNTFVISSIALVILLFTACKNSEKKEGNSTNSTSESEVKAKVEAPDGNNIDLKQKGDYTQLYSISEKCKLTPTQLGEALGYDESQVKEQSNYQGSCWYQVTHPSNFTVNYGISLEKWRDKDIVEDAIKGGQENDLIDIRVSESGDTYLKRHPVQGFLLLLNPNYGNPIKISYSYLNPNTPKLTDAQKEGRKQNTYKIANYLIQHYQN
ncbi:hypothetical protein OOZ15_03160 [Galbibacter sp. EGI 63066]|uniref:hypothetical protein n=1 Tax=Galbibacter sp. EGI 63066 TaxID=2993559 RepID=UPI0022490D27|nr:hypothetical protein [Galbibacter sp. EGI 63066]MCX2678929.1 hypothetical protein [Galbibacter sp. EGI 63066]